MLVLHSTEGYLIFFGNNLGLIALIRLSMPLYEGVGIPLLLTDAKTELG